MQYGKTAMSIGTSLTRPRQYGKTAISPGKYLAVLPGCGQRLPDTPRAGRSEDCQGTLRYILRLGPGRKIGRLPGDSSIHIPAWSGPEDRKIARGLLSTSPGPVRTGRSEDCQGILQYILRPGPGRKIGRLPGDFSTNHPARCMSAKCIEETRQCPLGSP